MNAKSLRRLVLTLATAAGLIAAGAAPAFAGPILSNHCEPLHTTLLERL